MQSIINFYRNLWVYNRPWFKSVVNWFILAIFAGSVTSFIKPDLLEVIIDAFAEKFGANPALDINLALQIFQQNLTASLVALFGGLILGLGSFLVVVVNGFLIGFVLMSLLFLGDNIFVSLAVIVGGLLPHGIFEIPAFLVASGLGLRLGVEWVQGESKGKRGAVLKNNFIQVFKFLPLIVLALFIAAIIEVFVSGKFVGNF